MGSMSRNRAGWENEFLARITMGLAGPAMPVIKRESLMV
jgi:hypothetical protein